MSEEAAERLRKTLEEKRQKAEAEASREAAEVAERRAAGDAIAERIGSVVRPVFAEAVAVFREQGFSADVLDELKSRTGSDYFLQIVLRPSRSHTVPALAISVKYDSSIVAFSVKHQYHSGSPVPDAEVPIEELTAELVWSWVDKLVARMP